MTKSERHLSYVTAARTMPNPCFSDIKATDAAQKICADLTWRGSTLPDGSDPIAGIAILNRVIRYLEAKRCGLWRAVNR